METTAVIYRVMLLGHIGAAIVGFGALIAHGSFHAAAVRSSSSDAVPVLRATAKVVRVAEYGLYAVVGFGIVLIALSDDVYRYSEPWISASFVVWVLIVGLVHGLIRPARARLLELAAASANESGGSSADDGDLADRTEAEPLLTRLAMGEAGTQLLLVGALVLMIWKPGH
ncbi:MAG: DUF2269 domain-containing protein [Acidimicrobiia bacterium]|nr:DUF2269 domain-containing protein [Acidimicrobiia bacterium]